MNKYKELLKLSKQKDYKSYYKLLNNESFSIQIRDEIYKRELAKFKEDNQCHQLRNLKNDIVQLYGNNNELVNETIKSIDRDIQDYENMCRLTISKEKENSIKEYFLENDFSYSVTTHEDENKTILQSIFKCLYIMQVYTKHKRMKPTTKKQVQIKSYINYLNRYNSNAQIKHHLNNYEFNVIDISDTFVNACLFYELMNYSIQPYKKEDQKKRTNLILQNIFNINKDYRVYENIETRKLNGLTLHRYIS